IISINYIIHHKNRSIHIVFIVFYVFFVIPLIFDYVVGKPSYSYSKPGFYVASRDEQTSYIYAMYLNVIPIIWRIFKKSDKIQSIKIDFLNNDILQRMRPLLRLIAISPLIAWMFAPNPFGYINYAAYPRGLLGVDSSDYHSLLSRL